MALSACILAAWGALAAPGASAQTTARVLSPETTAQASAPAPAAPAKPAPPAPAPQRAPTSARVLAPETTSQAETPPSPAPTGARVLLPAASVPVQPMQAAPRATEAQPPSTLALEDALRRLKAEDPAVRLRAAADLGRIRSEDAIGPLSNALAVDPSTDVRRQAVESLAYANGPDVGDVLLKALKDPAPEVRVAAARTLGAPGSADSLPSLGTVYALKEAYSDQDLGVRRAAIGSLAEVAVAASSGTEQALGQLLQDNAADVLREALSDPDARIRLEAAIALGRIGQYSGESVAIPLLKDANPAVRAQAAQCLGLVGSKEKSLPALSEAHSREQDASVSQALSDAISRLKTRLDRAAPPAPETPKE